MEAKKQHNPSTKGVFANEEEEIKHLQGEIKKQQERLDVLMKKHQIVPKKTLRQIKKECFLKKLEILKLFKESLGLHNDHVRSLFKTDIEIEIFGGFASEFVRYNYYEDHEFKEEHDSDIDMCIYSKSHPISLEYQVLLHLQKCVPNIKFTIIQRIEIPNRQLMKSNKEPNSLVHIICKCEYDKFEFKFDIFDNSIKNIRNSFQIPNDYDINSIYLNLNNNKIVFQDSDLLQTMSNFVNKEAQIMMGINSRIYNTNYKKFYKMITRQEKLLYLGYTPNVMIKTITFDGDIECNICKATKSPCDMKDFKCCPCNDGENICNKCFVKCLKISNECSFCKTSLRLITERTKDTKANKNWLVIPKTTYIDKYFDCPKEITKSEFTERLEEIDQGDAEQADAEAPTRARWRSVITLQESTNS